MNFSGGAKQGLHENAGAQESAVGGASKRGEQPAIRCGNLFGILFMA